MVWPLPTPGAEALTEQFLTAYSHRLAAVDRSKLFVRRENGLWLDATRPSATATATLQTMLRDLSIDGVWNQRHIDDLRTSLFHILERPEAYGVRVLRSEEFDRVPVFPLTNGRAIDARTLQLLDGDQIGDALLLDRSSPGIVFDPQLLNAGPDHPGARLAAHFEPDKSTPPKFALLRRIAFLLRGPAKAVDTAVIPQGDAGKSTFAQWLNLSLPGYVSVLDAVVALSPQGSRFTIVQHRLSLAKLVILDEVDKLEKPVTSGAFNALTADTLLIELKGQDAIESPRRGNVLMIGAATPNLELGQGGKERLGWAFDGEGIGVMPPEVRALVNDPAAWAWLSTKLILLAEESYRKNDHGDSFESRAAAAVLHLETANPLNVALADILTRDDSSSVWAQDIKQRLQTYTDVAQPVASKTLGAAMKSVFGRDMKALSSSRGGKSARYYARVRVE